MAILPVIRNRAVALRQSAAQLNLFTTYSTDPIIIRRQILTTRVFLVLFTISLFVLLLYTSITPQTINATARYPSQKTFEQLQSNYPDTIQCPCTQISIPYETFVRIRPSFHQVCTSQFVSQEWIDYVFGDINRYPWAMDVRNSLSAMWQVIASLCHSVMDTINNAWTEFAAQVLITSMALSRSSLEAKTRAAVDTLHQTALYNLDRSQRIMHRMSQSNGYLTGASVNFILAAGGSVLGTNAVFMVDTKYQMISDGRWCMCQRYGSCPISAGVYLYPRVGHPGEFFSTIRPNHTLDGLYVDCLPLLMAFGSTLKCFYDQSCLNILLSVYPRQINISALDETRPSRFSSTTLIKDLVDNLFLEEFINETIFESYYQQCAPKSCSYSYSRRFEWVYIITTLAALLGGLNVTFRLISPQLITIAFFIKEKFSRRKEKDQQTEQNNAFPSLLESNQPKSLLLKVFVVINEFNLFENYHARDAYDIKHGRFITRVYALSLTIAMTTLIIYTSQTVQTINEQVLLPTREQYEALEAQNLNGFQCPCTTISIPYRNLMSITPTFHQLCYSDLVQSWWHETHIYHWTLTNTIDFRYISAAYFRTLAMFCEIANLTINAAYHRFSSTAFVNAQAISRTTFRLQTDTFISTFINSTLLDFLYQVSLVNNILHGNQYISGMETNTYLLGYQVTQERIVNQRPLQIASITQQSYNDDGSPCYCALNPNCPLDQSIYVSFMMPGIYIACFMVDTALKSTLECWYSRSCINLLIQGFNVTRLWVTLPENVRALNPALPSQFSLRDPLEKIVNNLMVEYYNYSSSYENFYQLCQPAYCSFTYEQRSNIIYMITTVIGLFGGMNIVLRLMSQALVKLVHQRDKTDRTHFPSIYGQQLDSHRSGMKGSSSDQEMMKWSSLFEKIVDLNLFKTSSIQPEIIRRQRYQTRLYLILLTYSIVSIVLYTVIPLSRTTDTVYQQSYAEYENLRQKYGNSLQCPCTQISISNKAFISLDTTYHQVCSSNFVQPAWINDLFWHSYWFVFPRADIRIRGAAYYSLLGKLCELAKANIDQAKSNFLEEKFQISVALTESDFLAHAEATKEEFRVQTIRQFSYSLGLFRNLTHSSTFVSSYFLNWYGWIHENVPHVVFPISPVVFEDQCSCATRSDCVEIGGIYSTTTRNLIFEVTGLRIGCSVLETLFRSTLECLYNQTCVDTLVQYFSMSSATALSESLPSRFYPDSLIEEIVEELFVEQWQANASYKGFYEACAPNSCSYTIDQRQQVIFLISRILGFYGGLTVTLRFLTPYLIGLFMHIHHYFLRNRVQTIN